MGRGFRPVARALKRVNAVGGEASCNWGVSPSSRTADYRFCNFVMALKFHLYFYGDKHESVTAFAPDVVLNIACVCDAMPSNATVTRACWLCSAAAPRMLD